VPAVYVANETNGCTSTTNYCTLAGLKPTRQVTVSVTATQNGQSITMSATADIEPWCGNQFCG
jgi:hypothetical protein